jgi:hypothetical protein
MSERNSLDAWQLNDSQHVSSMDNRGHFHSKKIAMLALISCSAKKASSRSRSVWPKRHMAEQNIAVRRG